MMMMQAGSYSASIFIIENDLHKRKDDLGRGTMRTKRLSEAKLVGCYYRDLGWLVKKWVNFTLDQDKIYEAISSLRKSVRFF